MVSTDVDGRSDGLQVHRVLTLPTGFPMRRFTVALLALSASPLAAQRPDGGLIPRVDSVFTAWSRTSTPGCAVGVDRAGAPLIRRASGMANLEAGTPFTVGTISESGSVAKQFTAAALVLLARDGILSLDDDISKWIPEVKGIGKRINVRQILSHTSGLPDRYLLHAAQGRAAGEADHTNREVIDVVAHLRELNFDPGEDYLYSNTGYVVAATLVERASGKTFQQFTQERLFGPLGMTNTHWRVDHRVVVPGRAAAYAGTPATGFRNDHPFTRVYGAGGLNTTVDDFLKWSGALLAGTGQWGAVRDSLQSVIRLNDGTAITYGLGVTTDQWRGVKRVSHTGSTGGYRAAVYRFPEQQVAVALLCNGGTANPGDLANRVAAIVLGDALQPVATDVTPSIAMTPEALAAIAGRYHSPRTEEVMVLVVRNGNLADSLGGAVYVPLGGDRFRLRGAARELKVIREGSAIRARIEAPNARAVDYVRVEAPNVAAAALAAYAGTYTSPELGTRYTLVVRADSLLLDEGWKGTFRFLPLYRDGFSVDGNIVRFTRDARGRITGFVIWAGRVRHLRYDRDGAR